MVQALVYALWKSKQRGLLGIFLTFLYLKILFRSTVPEDAGIEPRTVATSALAVRRSNKSDRSHPLM
jgi:hypothetical protein